MIIAPRLSRSLAIALVLLGLVAMPPAASARGPFTVQFHFAGSHGYDIRVGGFGESAVIAASKSGGPPRKRHTWSTYIARGNVSPTAINGRFGELGMVDMRFHASGPVKHSKRRRHCRGADRYTIRPGFFVGTARFRGEGGYTGAVVHRVKGQSVTPTALHCRPRINFFRSASTTVGDRNGGKRARLLASHRSGPSALYFAAVRRGKETRYFAISEKSAGSVACYRGAYVVAPAATFSSNSALTSATLDPLAPFAGEGTFLHGPDGSKSWTGSLSVSFPGEPNVPLTGSQFKISFSHSL